MKLEKLHNSQSSYELNVSDDDIENIFNVIRVTEKKYHNYGVFNMIIHDNDMTIKISVIRKNDTLTIVCRLNNPCKKYIFNLNNYLGFEYYYDTKTKGWVSYPSVLPTQCNNIHGNNIDLDISKLIDKLDK